MEAMTAPARQSPLGTVDGLNKILLGLVGIFRQDQRRHLLAGEAAQVELNSQLRAAKIPGLEQLTPARYRGRSPGHDPRRRGGLRVPRREGRGGPLLRDRGQGPLPRQRLPSAGRPRHRDARDRQAIPTLEELSLPDALREIAALKNGIVLVTGPTGSGKSSTLAAIIDLINETRGEHIITIEDPIEFLHQHKKATVHQRELHSDTPTFALALRAALRQAPKVILVGEMRDVETIEIALEAAETGHLVLSTLHTIDASKTVDRIIGVFPKSEEQFVRVAPRGHVPLHRLAAAAAPGRRQGARGGHRDPEVHAADPGLHRPRRARGQVPARRHERR